MYFKQPLIFERINNEKSKAKGGFPNFDSTPVFALFRTGHKMTPFIYRNTIMTKELLHDFYNVSLNFKILSKEISERL